MHSARAIVEATDEATLRIAVHDIVQFRRTSILPDSSPLRAIARQIASDSDVDDYALRLAEDTVLLCCALKWAAA